jgi:tetratricopeptide (TPR) repeat protein
MFEQGMRQRLIQYLQQQVTEYGETQDHYRLAHYMNELGDRDAAELALRKAARIAADVDATPHLKLADFYDSIGDRESALIELRKAYYIDPKIPGLADNIRAHGMVPGPTVRIMPERLQSAELPQEETANTSVVEEPTGEE